MFIWNNLNNDITKGKYQNTGCIFDEFNKYYTELQEHHFVVSPDGNGPDCYRSWETLYLHRYPLVSKNNVTNHFIDLPIVQIEDWTKLNKSFLLEELNRIQTSKLNYNKLDQRWWWKKNKGRVRRIKIESIA